MDINTQKLLNTTASGKLAQQLDAQDEKNDGKISASVWNEFVANKGGKGINNYIDVVNAMKSLSTYAVRESKNNKTSVKETVKAWTEELVALSQAKKAEEEKAAKAREEKTAQDAEAIKVKAEEPEVQECFDKATGLLAEVANMPQSKYKLYASYNKEYNYETRKAILPDGRYIEAKLYPDGIDTIAISHDTTKDEGGKDGAEVVFHEKMAQYDNDHSDDTYDGHISAGFDYEKIKGVAERIFGKRLLQ